jgi:hypothetical protein
MLMYHRKPPTKAARDATKHDLEGYAIAATKNQVFEAILIMMLRSLQAISRAFFMINLPSRVPLSLGQGYFKNEQERD